jgi:hypothetical protein
MIRRAYGAGPLHLLGHLLAIAVAAYALARAFQPRLAPQPLNLAAWLLAGALLHDLVLLPAYTGLDRFAQRALGADRRRAVPILNHLRVPAVLSGVVLLVYAPRILDRQPQNIVNALGHRPPDYLGRWLAVTAALALGSAAIYAIRASRAAAARRSGRSPAPSPSRDRRPPSRAGAPSDDAR